MDNRYPGGTYCFLNILGIGDNGFMNYEWEKFENAGYTYNYELESLPVDGQ